jgi:uncharacterized protein
MTTPEALIAHLRQSRGFLHKQDIAPLVSALSGSTADHIPLGDDCAAIPDGDGFLLLAIEGFLNDFVERDPWFAGYCGVMVNASDVYAMGGRPIAVVDALWSRDGEHGRQILAGMAEASAAYQIPIVGGHANCRNDREHLAVAILGRAKRLLTSFDARPGDRLIAAVDLRGAYREPFPNWNASTGQPAGRLRGDLEILPSLAEDGLCRAAKDISMAGVCGTALMLMESSGVGGVIHVGNIPIPPGVGLERWLLTFPSYGFVLAAAEPNVGETLARFSARGLAASVIGELDDSGIARIAADGREATLWDFHAAALIGCGAPSGGKGKA